MNKVSLAEITLLSVAVTVATAVMFTPYFAAQIAGQDAWLSVLFAGLLGIVPAGAAGALMNRFPNQSIIQALPNLFGRVLGTLTALMFAGYFLFAAALAIWRMEVFTVRFLLPEAPQLAVRVLFMLCVCIAVLGGSRPLIRTSAYIVPLGFVVILLVMGLPVSRMDPAFLFPVFELGYRPMLLAGVLLFGWLCQIPLVFLMFQRYVQGGHGGAKMAILGVILSVLALELGAAGTLAAFGPRQAGSMYYPAFEVARIISIGAFLERIEVIFVAVWIAGIFLAAAFYVQVFVEGMSDILHFKGRVAKVLISAIAILSLIIVPEILELSFLQIIAIIRDYGSVTGIIIGGLFPLIMLARVILAPIKGKGRGPGPGNDEQENENENNEYDEGN